MQTLHNIIGGAAAKSTSPRSAPVFNPATGEQSAILPLSTAAELDAAVAAAKLALPEWASTPPLKRVKFFFRFKQLLDENTDRIARAISSEHGKTHADAVGDSAHRQPYPLDRRHAPAGGSPALGLVTTTSSPWTARVSGPTTRTRISGSHRRASRYGLGGATVMPAP